MRDAGGHTRSPTNGSTSAEKIEFVNGIFASEQERLIVLGMLLENLGIDRAIRFAGVGDDEVLEQRVCRLREILVRDGDEVVGHDLTRSRST